MRYLGCYLRRTDKSFLSVNYFGGARTYITPFNSSFALSRIPSFAV